MELTTALIWTLRIVLPIILFCVYIKFQTSKDDQALSKPTSTKNRYARSIILAHRKAAAGKPKHEDLSNLVLKDQSQAPELFQGAEGGRRPGGRGSGRSAGGQRGEERRDRPKREPREPREPKEHGEKGERESRRSQRQPSELEKRLFEEAPVATPAAEGAAQLTEDQEKMHLESLLNYVAFNRKDQQRNFMLDEDGEPPPPPPKKPAVAASTTGGGEQQSVKELAKMTTEKANEEAQMVLRGAINFKRVDVAKDLHAQLVAQNVDISESTYELMIEASILAKDISSSTDFLMKMESSGHSPCSELLDKVLDLYSSEKTQREQRKKMKAAEVAEPIKAEEARAKLKSDAPIFVPSFGIPPPPPKPKEAPDGAGTEGGEPAAAPTEAADQTPSAEATTQSEPRTKLKSAAQAFVPQFGNFEMEHAYVSADTTTWGLPMVPSEVGQAILHGLQDREYAEEDYILPGESFGENSWKGDENRKGRRGDDASNGKDKNGGGKAGSKGRGKQAKSGKGKSGEADTPAKTDEAKKMWKPKESVPSA
eukprot:TRINITY_DN103852_c0_g1_i1.p1 TRINITY_DN103852_c0_g1~~TRINITY_DN103852_c0_g1_i1.p1  ORF type:complete len:539 (-),score=132.48 TRINITY_DN103852_c0_g1_i1:135-1751(-)